MNKIVKNGFAIEVLSTDTEQLIKNTAKDVFFKQGLLHATTQDIADAAGINRASIRYYYSSRKLLFEKVFAEAMEEMDTKLMAIVRQELPFRQMVEYFIELFLQKSMQHPYLELFLITELNTNPKKDSGITRLLRKLPLAVILKYLSICVNKIWLADFPTPVHQIAHFPAVLRANTSHY